jgi:hypothetical protein
MPTRQGKLCDMAGLPFLFVAEDFGMHRESTAVTPPDLVEHWPRVLVT